MLIVAEKQDNVSVRPVGWATSVIVRVMKTIMAKIVRKYAIVKMRENVMHKTVHALVVRVGSVKLATQNVNPECLASIVRKNANAILIMQFIVMEPMAVAFVKRCGEVSLSIIILNRSTNKKKITPFCHYIMCCCRYRKIIFFYITKTLQFASCC